MIASAVAVRHAAGIAPARQIVGIAAGTASTALVRILTAASAAWTEARAITSAATALTASIASAAIIASAAAAVCKQ